MKIISQIKSPLLAEKFLLTIRFLIIIVLIIGIYFRFVNLDYKIYWFDETYTLLRVSGYTEAEMLKDVFKGDVIKAENLQKYQHINPEKHLINTINSLVLEDVQHPPFYYILARWATQLFGNSITAIRGLSALISLLVLPAIYWLCIELFELPLMGWLAMIFISISPFHFIFAQEAREYSLWTLTIVLSSASLLRAIRCKNHFNWLIYSISIACSYYTFPLSILVAISHGIYILIIEKFSWDKTLKYYTLASVVALLAFSPWLWVIFHNISGFSNTTDWLKETIQFSKLFQLWLRNLSYLFCDLEYKNPKFELLRPVISIFVIYTVYYLCRYSSKKKWLFVVLLITVTSLPMIIPDLVFGGMRSIISRYLIPSYLGIHLAVSYFFATKINSVSISAKTRHLWRIMLLILISLGILSGVVSSHTQVWWNKSKNEYNPSVAALVNKGIKPLIISDTKVANILSLSHLLLPTIHMKLNSACVTSCSSNTSPSFPTQLIRIPDQFTDIFLFKPSDSLYSELSHKYNFQSVPHTSNSLWYLNQS